MNKPRHIIMLASENDALKNGKVGGVGDVVRDLPNALATLGWQVTVIIPSYGFLHNDNPSTQISVVQFPFAGTAMAGTLYEVTPKIPHEGVRHLVFEHPLIRGTPIYCNDPPEHAFAQDATKYALFCSAIGQYLKSIPQPVLLHLHDWHTPTLLFLRELHPQFTHLKNVKTVFTIHNAAIQGNRPIRGPYATVEQWFPELFNDTEWIKDWKDARYTTPNITPMVVGIKYADKANTVSPTYAEEILQPSDTKNGLFRGEGLDPLLRQANRDGRLFGILNGCDYPEHRQSSKMSFSDLCDLLIVEVSKWKQKRVDAIHDEVIQRIQTLKDNPPAIILTSVTRIVEQKIKILFEKSSQDTTVLEEILNVLVATNGIYIVLGTGATDYEDRLTAAFRLHKRCLYLKGYSEKISDALYANGTLFMMPSSFEPCGIGQMIAMRDGQPCIVHAVGGLRDTVIDDINGFQFSGGTLREQADQCVAVTKKAMTMRLNDPVRWNQIVEEARQARFTWEKSARQYVELMYGVQ